MGLAELDGAAAEYEVEMSIVAWSDAANSRISDDPMVLPFSFVVRDISITGLK